MALWCVLVCSGLVLWLGSGIIDNSVRAWMIPVHSIAAGIGFAAALGHIYLAVGVNPDSLQGMKNGTIKADYAMHHHGAWVDELVAEGKVTKKGVIALIIELASENYIKIHYHTIICTA